MTADRRSGFSGGVHDRPVSWAGSAAVPRWRRWPRRQAAGSDQTTFLYLDSMLAPDAQKRSDQLVSIAPLCLSGQLPDQAERTGQEQDRGWSQPAGKQPGDGQGNDERRQTGDVQLTCETNQNAD